MSNILSLLDSVSFLSLFLSVRFEEFLTGCIRFSSVPVIVRRLLLFLAFLLFLLALATAIKILQEGFICKL